MAQTVSRRNRYEGVWEKYNSADLLVIDEAHHATADGWERAINQWPGRVVGLTATPWRLAKHEGFRHLFDQLILGPQITKMQSDGWLAEAQALMPDGDELILGGIPASNGEYSETGIEAANRDRPLVMTGSALQFWQKRAGDRQTIVYAVSVGHAQNLAAVLKEAGIPAEVLLGDTPPAERARMIKQFQNGAIKALVNVAVATEGFDLPDAACVVMTRPTLSLSLYLQMIGRGLRPKSDGGNCLILDLAGNVERHGLPDDDRIWSLEPRGRQTEGDVPVVRCDECDGVSPAASRNCRFCDKPFGKVCQRCVQWRAWKHWSAETYCGDSHDIVCNLCHPDAHIKAALPIEERLKVMLKRELSEGGPEVNPSSVNRWEDARNSISEMAEKLVCAHRISDLRAYVRLLDQLQALLKKEKQQWQNERASEAAQEEIELWLNDEPLQPLFKEFASLLEAEVRKKVASVKLEVSSSPPVLRLLINGEEANLEAYELLRCIVATFGEDGYEWPVPEEYRIHVRLLSTLLTAQLGSKQ